VLQHAAGASQVRRVLVGWNAEREAVIGRAMPCPLLVRAKVSRSGSRPEGDVGSLQERGGYSALPRAVTALHVDGSENESGSEDVGHILLSHAPFSAPI